jgi:RNA polymerase sigma-70 factor (sigma-E family)
VQPLWNLLGLLGGYEEYEGDIGDRGLMMDVLQKGRAQTEFERFAAERVDGLIRAAFLMVGNQAEAEDLVQECLLRVARRWPRVHSMKHPGAYARRVLFNLILDDRRARRRRHEELRDGALPDQQQDAATTQPEERLDLLQALEALPPRQRAILVLRYFGDLPESEIAATLECAPGTVKSGAARGLARLREAIGDPADGDPRSDDSIQGAERWTPN